MNHERIREEKYKKPKKNYNKTRPFYIAFSLSTIKSFPQISQQKSIRRKLIYWKHYLIDN